MTERGILFSAPMVRALLDGTKTQTRRICKNQPYSNGFHFDGRDILCHNDYLPPSAMLMDYREGGQTYTTSNMEGWEFCCPYGQPGDRLWVRETWGVVSNAWDDDGNLIDWTPDRAAMPVLEMPFGQGYYTGHVIYAADGSYEWAGDDDGGGEPRTAWHPSIHMPRAASRILLEIVSVRVERLQDISETDAAAEGWTRRPEVSNDPQVHADAARDWYMDLWEQINGAGSWAANPWVWVVEFKRVQL